MTTEKRVLLNDKQIKRLPALIKKMQDRNLSMIARQLGVSQVFLSYIKNGKRRPSSEYFEMLEQYFKESK